MPDRGMAEGPSSPVPSVLDQEVAPDPQDDHNQSEDGPADQAQEPTDDRKEDGGPH